MCSCNPAQLITILLALPLIGMALTWIGPFAGSSELAAAKRAKFNLLLQGLGFLVVLLILSTYLSSKSVLLDSATYTLPLISDLGVSFSLYLDSLNLWFIFLANLLFFLIALLARPLELKSSAKFAAFYALQFSILLTLSTNDLLIFYVAWELMLIPVLIIMGYWGTVERKEAVMKFILYTAAGSLLMFAAIIYLAIHVYSSTESQSLSFSWETIKSLTMSLSLLEQKYLFLAFMLAFLIKVPMFPLHGWLADSYRAAPYALNIVLAGILGKLGIYGIIKFVIPFFPAVFVEFAPLLALLALLGVFYGGMLAFAEDNLKNFLAYSSFSHVSYCLLALAAIGTTSGDGNFLTQSAQSLAVFQVLSHGLIIAGLFLVVLSLEKKFATQSISQLGGVASRNKLLASFALVLSLAAIGLPTTSGFVAEFMIFLKVAEVYFPLLLIAVLGVVLSAVYTLTMFMRVFFLTEGALVLKAQEERLQTELVGGLLFLVVLIFVFGLFPQLVFDSFARFIGI